MACWLTPFMVAVTVAFWLLLTVPEDAAKVAVLCPDGTVTLVRYRKQSVVADQRDDYGAGGGGVQGHGAGA